MSDARAFVDFVRIHVKAGDGGKGYISFRREKGIEFGGPDGGDGGRGGSVWIEAEPLLVTLLDFKSRPSWRAVNGQHGAPKQCSGRSGEDLVLKAPLGTSIIDADSGAELGDLTAPGQRILLARGGDGGRGNQHFATATNKAPRKADDGWPGEEKHYALELKVIADAGLIGLPNAGKSTLLSKLTHATPKIAAYPFTTISPNLGVFDASDFSRQIVVADVPGLIEGAHKGQGLGHRFLRHVERTRTLVHLVAPGEGGADEPEFMALDPRPESLLYAWDLVERELAQYSPALLEKPLIGVLSKTDLLAPEQARAIIEHFRRERGVELLPICAVTDEGIAELRARIEAAALAQDKEPEGAAEGAAEGNG